MVIRRLVRCIALRLILLILGISLRVPGRKAPPLAPVCRVGDANRLVIVLDALVVFRYRRLSSWRVSLEVSFAESGCTVVLLFHILRMFLEVIAS